ncbi:MAG: corrinoid protein [Chloroflexi bacterium]|nr:corrinoid protein [Chloroflexota bacterium]
MEPNLQTIFDGIVDGNAPLVREKVTEALGAGLEPATILNQAMVAAMAEVGRRFEGGEYYVPDMLVAARAMRTGTEILKPRLQLDPVRSAGKAVIGTVKGDLHDIGKNLVGMMLEGAGFEIVDLGTDVAPDKFVDAVRASGATLIGMSALLTTTMPNMKSVIEALEKAGVRAQVKVMVGGAPLTAEYARQIGADGFASDASRAVTLAQTLNAGLPSSSMA